MTKLALAVTALLTLGALPAHADTITTQLTAQAGSTRIDAGMAVTITGRLTKAPGTTPIAGAQVPLSFCNDDFCGEAGVAPVTDANGRYRATVTPIRSGHYHADYLPADAVLAASSADTANIVVLQPAKITSFTAARDTAGKVATTGTIDFPGFTPSPIPVRIQYLSGSGCWTTATTIEAAWNGTTFAFSSSTGHPAPGVWRAFYPGTPDFVHSATSKPTFVR
ncbi:hypothetical protein [Amycolatopsis sp. H20-H5]|uniref:hypothetical protein n=1 Tax=Amycolatopsis sp. H20-H5 TaxID=3046309 RepID=UPI002DBEA6C8|nr:hypothetical protein [Amycolatopsis sp. H20-H5]MEC3976350.1 hypothetical protein [Amycolatopsis sp. H20-H5]